MGKGIISLKNNSNLILFSILFLSLIIRILALLSLKNTVYFDYLLWDERVYHTWAENLARGTLNSPAVYEMAPLPAYIMAAIYKILSPEVLYIRLFNIVLGVSTCLFVYLTGKHLFNNITGVIACIVVCLYKPFIFYSVVPLKTALSVFLFALIIYLFVIAIYKPAYIKILFIGIFTGLILNVRPNILPLIPVIPLLIIWCIEKKNASRRYALIILGVFVFGFFISVSPFVIRNYIKTGNLAMTAPQTGINLYIANNPDNKVPYYRPVPFASSNPFLQSVQFQIEASRKAGKKLTSIESSDYWTKEVIENIKKNPGYFMTGLLEKCGAFLNRFEACDHYNIGFVSNFAGFFKIPFFTISLILPLGMAAFILNFTRSKLQFALFMIFLIYGATLIIFFPTSRFRLPLFVILIPFAVHGVSELFLSIKKKSYSRIWVYLSIVLFFTIIEYLPVRGTDDMTAYYNTHAVILDSGGLEDEAVKYWEKSSKMNKPYSAYANLSLAGKYLKKKDIDKAVNHLNLIPDSSFAASDKYEMMGDIMMLKNQIKRAIQSYQTSLNINSGQTRTRKKLINILLRIDKKRALREYKNLVYISSFYDI